jgi:PAS domain S-box-containing protein
VSWNGGATRLYGYSAEEILGRPVSILVPPGNLAELCEIKERVERSQSVERLETVRRQKDGQLIDVSLTVSPIRDVSGRVTGASSISRNITRRKRAEEALRRAESRFRRLADSNIIGIFTEDATGHIVDANEAFLRMLGYTSEELQAGMLRWDEITPPEHHGVNARIHQQLIATGAADPVELEYIRRDGSRVSCLVGLASLESSAEHAIGFVLDLTEPKKAGEALRRSEEQFRDVAENIHEVFWMMNAAGTEILYINPAYEKIWGRTCESLRREPMSWLESIHPEDRAQAHEVFERQTRGEHIDSDYRILRPDGSERWIRNRAFAVRAKTGEISRVVGIAEDITERRRAEAALHVRTQALEAAAVGILITDPKGTIVWANAACKALTGYTSAELVGQNPRLLKSDRQDQAFHRGLWTTVLSGKVWHGELINRRKDGRLYTEEMTMTPSAGRLGRLLTSSR